MTPPDKDLPANEEQPAEDPLGLLIRAVRAVLTQQERELLTAFNGITESKVRQSVIDVTCALAGLGSHANDRNQPTRTLNAERIRSAILSGVWNAASPHD